MIEHKPLARRFRMNRKRLCTLAIAIALALTPAAAEAKPCKKNIRRCGVSVSLTQGFPNPTSDGRGVVAVELVPVIVVRR